MIRMVRMMTMMSRILIRNMNMKSMTMTDMVMDAMKIARFISILLNRNVNGTDRHVNSTNFPFVFVRRSAFA